MQEITASTRRPRFHRASEPPPFRLTEDDVAIVRLLARHRFLRSTHISALVGRSLDRTNHRLNCLFHASYIDRPRAQLDYYPTAGSAPIAYALADRGARLLIQRDGFEFANVEWSRKNREAGRPFIEHQLEVMDLLVALQLATRTRRDVAFIHPKDIIAEVPASTRAARNPLLLRAKLSHQGTVREVGVVPDLAFGFRYRDGTRRCYVAEIDRGTMPVVRSDPEQTSFERKMRVYLAAHAAKQHERQFGWKNFRVLTITTDSYRKQSMQDALRSIPSRSGTNPTLFYFATRHEISANDPLAHVWQDGRGQNASLL